MIHRIFTKQKFLDTGPLQIALHIVAFGVLVVSMLASGTQDRVFDPGRSRPIFRAKKSTACLPWGGGK